MQLVELKTSLGVEGRRCRGDRHRGVGPGGKLEGFSSCSRLSGGWRGSVVFQPYSDSTVTLS